MDKGDRAISANVNAAIELKHAFMKIGGVSREKHAIMEVLHIGNEILRAIPVGRVLVEFLEGKAMTVLGDELVERCVV